jgi:hypothetical protein
VLAVGGGNDPATNTAELIDLGVAAPSWSYVNSMSRGRRTLNPVLLPDGTVLVIGGTATGQNDEPVYEAEVFDPETGQWRMLARMQRPRTYHSTAVLLPDGRVLAAGSDGEFTAEIYSPPYLFRGPRPTISSAPASVAYGEQFQITTPAAQDIAEVVLIRPGAMTHSVNMDQRYVGLAFQAGAGSLSVDVPSNANAAPAGIYMLFVVNSNGVPSQAAFVEVGAGGAGTGASGVTPARAADTVASTYSLPRLEAAPFASARRRDGTRAMRRT